ncbi:leucine-rich repeat extensin-like protein 3 [Iris pallida]|uniref:Leucine-rich repeat extensin-like protein 3 n=1 Tax=Iris pallida TaxID=29817 RepID=A0AAX6H5U9_IRIPA|nr:leucine-rich repeat extensin-like protein 3 [Iris pallida]
MGFLLDGGGSTRSQAAADVASDLAARPRRLPTRCCKAREAARRRREGRDRSAGSAALAEGRGRRADSNLLVAVVGARQADVGGSPRSWLGRRWWSGRLETTSRWSDLGRGASCGDRGGEVALDGGRRPEEHSAVALRW